MRRKVDDTILIKLRPLDAGLGRIWAEYRVGVRCFNTRRNLLELIRGFRERWQRLPKERNIGDCATAAATASSAMTSEFCCSRGSSRSKTGSANPIKGFFASAAAALLRSTLRLESDGSTVRAWARISQSTSLSAWPAGSLVTRTCGGKLVSAPLRTRLQRAFGPIMLSMGPNTSRYSSKLSFVSNGSRLSALSDARSRDTFSDTRSPVSADSFQSATLRVIAQT
jgi:hypothetical protein